MSPDHLTQLILQYRYLVLIPLSFIEGPIVAFVAGTLASFGYFNMYFLAALFLVRDVGMDAVYYGIGYFGGDTKFADKMLKKIGITESHIGGVRELWTRRPWMTMFIGKLAYGIASAFIVVAGMVRMPFKLFFKYGVIVAVVEYGGLLLAGYFYGASFGGDITHLVKYVQYSAAILAVLIIAFYGLALYMRKKLLQADEADKEPTL